MKKVEEMTLEEVLEEFDLIQEGKSKLKGKSLMKRKASLEVAMCDALLRVNRVNL